LEALQPLEDQIGLSPGDSMLRKRKLSTLFLMYREHQQIALNQLMEDFCEKAKQIGVILRAADFKDI
jgi:hypothetical protein